MKPSSRALEPIEHKLTYRDLEYTPDDGNRYEVIDGELYVSPFPGTAHQRVIAALMRIMGPHIHKRGLGELFPAGLMVVLDDPTGVGPDLVYIAKAHLAQLSDDGYHGSPDLLVEVLSSKPQLDRFVKFNKYARAGVPHYWIVDPERRTLDVYRLEEGRYVLAAEIHRNDRFTPSLFPDLTIEMIELWG